MRPTMAVPALQLLRNLLAAAALVSNVAGSTARADDLTPSPPVSLALVSAPEAAVPAAPEVPAAAVVIEPQAGAEQATAHRRLVTGAVLTSIGGLLLAAGGGTWLGLASQDFGVPAEHHGQGAGIGALIGMPLMAAGTALVIPGIVKLALSRSGRRTLAAR